MAKNAKFWHIVTESGLESKGGGKVNNVQYTFDFSECWTLSGWTLLDIIGQNWTFIPGFTEMVAKTAVYHF